MSLIDTFARIFSSRASSSIALGDSPSSSRPPSEIDVGRASLNQSAPSGRLREVKAPGQFEDSFNMSVPGGRLAERESPGTIKSSAPDTINKGSSVGPLIAYHTLGEPVWAPRDYAAFAREGFMQNAIVYRSVRMIAEAAASIPLLLYEGTREIEDHPLIGLLRRPSLDHTGTDFLEAWYGFLLVSGNAYAEAVALDGELRELHILRPDRMKVIPGLDGWPEGYEYTANGRSVRFIDDVVDGVRPILHVRLFHPVNDHYGMSPIEAAATAIDIHNTASGWNKALLDNSARPSGALVYAASNGQMTDEQFTRLKGELETNFQGARAAGRPLLLEGGLDWKPLSLSPKDMDFIEAKNAAAREIALAIGVPPMLLGIPGDNTYSNYQEAQRAFWRQTVLPLVNRTARALASWLSPAFSTSSAPSGRLRAAESLGANKNHGRPRGTDMLLELRPDLDQIEALAPERDALWKRLEAASFLTTDEKRAAAGYDAQPDSASPQLKYREDQPRVPAGNPDGGRWTDGDRVAMAKIIQGAARYLLRNPKVLKPAEKTLEDLLKPGGKELGIRRGGATSGIRTINRSDFEKLKADLLDGTTEVPARPAYTGKWFRRSDGSIVGVRTSEQHGETLEVIKSLDGSTLGNGYKVHFNDQ
ncbi:phage portal protein [Hyphomicrobium sp. 802]|uniref:phage portal protein n=1 Tax=unclassified Hyphomicrobium TaxID=2619925 RepID=UPI000213D36A|nr:Phage portal protein, HK97 (modular protein) [Hyphomicrobium sp. MC1]